MESSKGRVMTVSEIQEALFEWVTDRSDIFNAPYGILIERKSNKGDKQRLTVTFGIARGLDAIVTIYTPRYIEVKDTRNGTRVFQSFPDMMDEFNRQFGRSEA